MFEFQVCLLIRRASCFLFLDNLFPCFAYLFLIMFIVSSLLKFPLYGEHLFNEISYNLSYIY